MKVFVCPHGSSLCSVESVIWETFDTAYHTNMYYKPFDGPALKSIRYLLYVKTFSNPLQKIKIAADF